MDCFVCYFVEIFQSSEMSDLSEEDESELDSDLMKTDSDEGEDDDNDGSNRRTQVENCKYSRIVTSLSSSFLN